MPDFHMYTSISSVLFPILLVTYKYLLTVVDRFTRWPEAIPMKDIIAQSCADSFLLHWVARFESPTIITTDRGAQFASLLWTEMCQFLGSKLPSKHFSSSQR